MQNRYVGDVGDFGKYGLLGALCAGADGAAPLRLGVVWHLVHDEAHNEDAQHTLDAWKDDYNNTRPHGSLAGVPPAKHRSGAYYGHKDLRDSETIPGDWLGIGGGPDR